MSAYPDTGRVQIVIRHRDGIGSGSTVTCYEEVILTRPNYEFLAEYLLADDHAYSVCTSIMRSRYGDDRVEGLEAELTCFQSEYSPGERGESGVVRRLLSAFGEFLAAGGGYVFSPERELDCLGL